jgi:hypothetical protein
MEEFVRNAVKIVGDIQEKYFARGLFWDKRVMDECSAEILEFVSQFGPEELEAIDDLLHW